MILTPKIQRLLLRTDKDNSTIEILENRQTKRSYDGFLLKKLIDLKLITSRRIIRKRVFSLTSKGRELKKLLLSLPEISLKWEHKKLEDYYASLKF